MCESTIQCQLKFIYLNFKQPMVDPNPNNNHIANLQHQQTGHLHQSTNNPMTPTRDRPFHQESPTHEQVLDQNGIMEEQEEYNINEEQGDGLHGPNSMMEEEEVRSDRVGEIEDGAIKDQMDQQGYKAQGESVNNVRKTANQTATVQKPEGARKRRTQGNFARYQDQDVPRKKRALQQPNNHRPTSQNLFKSKRKIRPQMNSTNIGCYNPEERLAMIENTFRECHIGNKKTMKKATSNNFSYLTSWIQHQFFYSNYQRPYFEENDFKELLQAIGLRDNPQLKFKDFKQIQRCMGKPRLFTATLIHEQRMGVEDTREIARQYSKTQNISILTQRLLNSNSNAYYQRVYQLKVGTPVLALANCGHLHLGTVLGQHKQNTLVVKFCNLQLGIQKIHDSSISSEYSICKQPELRQNNQANNQTKTNDLIESVDYFSVALFLRSLFLKSLLVQTLRQLNIQATKLQQSGEPIPEQLRTNVSIVVQYLESMNRYMKPILGNFRLRGVSSYRKQQIAKSFKKLLINPLNFMEKELQANIQEVDQAAIKQIGEILQIQQENKVQQLTKTLCENSKCFIQAFQSEQGKLVKNCLAILIGMKMENRPFQLVENKYMKNISQIIYNHFGEQLNQINDCISAICNK